MPASFLTDDVKHLFQTVSDVCDDLPDALGDGESLILKKEEEQGGGGDEKERGHQDDLALE